MKPQKTDLDFVQKLKGGGAKAALLSSLGDLRFYTASALPPERREAVVRERNRNTLIGAHLVELGVISHLNL